MKLMKSLIAAGLQSFALAGCYIVPTADGNYSVYVPVTPPPLQGQPAVASSQPAMPKVLHARLYPDNDVATQTGMVSGTVTNMMTGKGRFSSAMPASCSPARRRGCRATSARASPAPTARTARS